MTIINTHNTLVALPLELYRQVWTFLLEFDKPKEPNTTLDYASVRSFMATHKLAKEVFDSLSGWRICANALVRETRHCFVSIRDRERLAQVCRLAAAESSSATRSERHDDDAIRQEDSSSLSGSNVRQSSSSAPWIKEGVCVQVLEPTSGWYESGVIKEIISDTEAIFEFRNGESMRSKSVPIGDMDMIQPREYDRVFVTCGSTVLVGMQVELMCVDGSAAIIKDSRDEFTIVDYRHLAKIELDNLD